MLADSTGAKLCLCSFMGWQSDIWDLAGSEGELKDEVSLTNACWILLLAYLFHLELCPV